ncbi:MAG: CapA family protein [Ornithinimicrobium sp.]
MLGSGAVDLILGTHVHVPQPCERINGRYVLYGMGNSLSNQSPDSDPRLRPETQDGMVADGHVIEPVGPQHQPESADRPMSTLRSLGSCDPIAVAS